MSEIFSGKLSRALKQWGLPIPGAPSRSRMCGIEREGLYPPLSIIVASHFSLQLKFSRYIKMHPGTIKPCLKFKI